jgi:hypothetical protein
MIHKMHFVLGKHSYSRYRQPKQPPKMVNIKTIDSRNCEVNSFYTVSFKKK